MNLVDLLYELEIIINFDFDRILNCELLYLVVLTDIA